MGSRAGLRRAKVASTFPSYAPRSIALPWSRGFPARSVTSELAIPSPTSSAGELVAMCGPLTSYHDGPIGVIKEGAYADLLIVDGNPLDDITVIGGNELWMKAPMREAGVGIETMTLIMKDGVIYKNTLAQ